MKMLKDVTRLTFNAEHNGGTPKVRQCATLAPSACCDLLHLHSEIEMKKNLKYRRYMLFTWSEYDNVEPFSNVHAHSDSLDEIKDSINCDGFYRDERVDEYGNPLYCIFDRIEGVMIE